jgi:hypothetical protein
MPENIMSRTLSRVAGGALGIIVAAAVGNVAVARAQTQTTEVISTACGAGTIEKCGDKPIESCDSEYVFEFDPVTRTVRLVVKYTNCKSLGTIPIYKNKFATACTSSSGGSTGTGLVGMRGSGDEEPIDASTCE